MLYDKCLHDKLDFLFEDAPADRGVMGTEAVHGCKQMFVTEKYTDLSLMFSLLTKYRVYHCICLLILL